MMKKLSLTLLIGALALPAMAADYHVPPEHHSLPDYGPGPVAPAANPWGRPYVGVFGGIGSGDITYESNVVSGNVSTAAGGLEAGIRAGYDYAHGSFLVGIVGDYAITNVGLRGSLNVPGLTSIDAEYRLASLGTLRARLGVTQKNNLFYAHGGFAVGTMHIRENGNKVDGIIDNPRMGFAAGVGHEYAISEHGTIQTEYSYVHLGKFDVYSSGGTDISDQLSFHKLTTGLNIRF